MRDLGQIWVYLSASPLLHLTLTLAVYELASLVYRRCRMTPLLNPVMLSIVALVLVLKATGTSYGQEHTEVSRTTRRDASVGPRTTATS